MQRPPIHISATHSLAAAERPKWASGANSQIALSGSLGLPCLQGMYIIYVLITVVAALLYGYAAFLNFVGAESVKVVADRVQVSRKWMIPFGVLLASGAVGLVIGLVVPAIGIAAAIGLVLYFICALSAHIRVHDRGIGGAVTFLVLALAVLTVNIVYRTQSG
jgi:hypothetical protein